MSHPPATPEERYAAIVEALVSETAVTFGSPSGKGFGSSALKIDTRIFAMLFEGKLIVKPPRRRVDALIASGEGERFDPGNGRPMKEWLTVKPTAAVDWLSLAKEARTFVGPKR